MKHVAGGAVTDKSGDQLAPLEALRRQAREKPALRLGASWQNEMIAAIAAARASGVRSAALVEYEELLR